VKEKDALVNGEIVEVSHVLKNGTIRLKDGRSLPPEYRTFQLGYATTSYGSQGKTVDHVLISDSGVKAATNARQWYVDISRGRRSATLFTSDKAALMERICRHGDASLALEVFEAEKKTETPRVGLRVRQMLWQLAQEAMRRTRMITRREQVQALRHMFAEKSLSLKSTDQEPTRTR
jgi:ATP-dependent exoDNAse (exonuclease V) alpha subunit